MAEKKTTEGNTAASVAEASDEVELIRQCSEVSKEVIKRACEACPDREPALKDLLRHRTAVFFRPQLRNMFGVTLTPLIDWMDRYRAQEEASSDAMVSPGQIRTEENK